MDTEQLRTKLKEQGWSVKSNGERKRTWLNVYEATVCVSEKPSGGFTLDAWPLSAEQVQKVLEALTSNM